MGDRGPARPRATGLAVAALTAAVTFASAPAAAQEQDSITVQSPVTTTRAMSGDAIDRFPADDAFDLLPLLPGVTTGLRGRITLRGSRPGDQTLWVDGVPFRSMDTGEGELSLAPNTLAEASVWTGVLPAGAGDAAGGVIALTTRRGVGPWQAALSYESDGLQGTAATGRQRLEAAAGGTAFGLVHLFAGGAADTRQAAELAAGIADLPAYTYAGIDTTVGTPTGTPGDSTFVSVPQIIQYGGTCDAGLNDEYECQGRRRPRGWTSDLRWTARAEIPYASGASLSVSFIGSERQEADWRYLMNQEGRPGTRTTASAVTAHWRQPLPATALGRVTVGVTVSRQRERAAVGAIASDDLTRDPTSMALPFEPLGFANGFDHFAPVAPDSHLTRGADEGWLLARLDSDEAWDAAIENLRYARGTVVPYPGRDDLALRALDRVNAYAVDAAIVNRGVDFGVRLADERRTYGRIAVDWRQAEGHLTRLTLARTWARVGRWEMGLTARTDGFGYAGEPMKSAFAVEHRARVAGLALDLGARWDRFDAGTLFPLLPGRIHSNPAFDPSVGVEAMTCVEADPADCDTLLYVWSASRTHTAFSPRIAVAAPLSERTTARVAFGVHAQAPPLALVAAGVNNDVTVATGRGLFGGDVQLSRTLLYEIAARHMFGDGLVVDVALYQKDLRDQFAYRSRAVYDPALDSTISIAVLTNADFGTARGIEVGLDKRWGNQAQVRAAYAYQRARGTASDATEFVYGLSQLVSGLPLDAPVRTRDDRVHTIGGMAFWRAPDGFAEGTVLQPLLRGVAVYAAFEVRSGLPYTSLLNDTTDVTSDWLRLSGAAPAGALRDATTPWEKLIDLRVSKTIAAGPAAVEFYADVRNLFGWANVATVFAETGGTVHDGLRTRVLRDQLQSIEGSGWGWWITQTKLNADSSTYTVEGIDLRNLAGACAEWWAWAGTPFDGHVSCVMLERTERRFGDGDGVFDVEEQAAAVNAWYDATYAAARFHGPGRSVRVGVRVGF